MLELADIIAPAAPPPAPPPYGWIALGVVSLALILFFLLRLWLKRTRARRLARTALKHAERALQRGRIDTRAAAFQAGMALRLAYHEMRVPAPGREGESSHTTEWKKFMHALDLARYSPYPIDMPHATHLLAETRHWIERAP